MIIRVAEWSRTPGGRKRAWGPFSAEEFRDDVLVPALAEHDRVTVDLDGAAGYAGSFLHEVFWGLAERIGPSEVLRRVEVVCTDEPHLVDDVRTYVTEVQDRVGSA